jgi:glycosyltransferase involved in cell wall biosynthesis
MKKINIACISEEINQTNIHGNNIRLIKLLKYFPQKIAFNLFTVKNGNIYDFSQFDNVDIYFIRATPYNWVLHKFKRRNAIKKVLWYLINYYSTIDYLWAFKACRRIIENSHNYDYVLLQVPSLLNIIYGKYISKRSNLPIIFDLRDDLVNFKSRIGIKILEKWMVEYGDLVACTTHGSKNNLSSKYPQWKEKLKYIPNGYDHNDIVRSGRSEGSVNEVTNIVYTGVLYKSRLKAVEMIFEVISKADIELKDISKALKVIFYSDNRRLDEIIAKYNLDHIVERRDSIHNANDYYRILETADYLLSMNMDTPFSIPGKMYEYLAVNPRVIHIDNSSICTEVLEHFPHSKLILIDNISELSKILKNVALGRQNNLIGAELPLQYVKTHSRENIALNYANLLLEHNQGE